MSPIEKLALLDIVLDSTLNDKQKLLLVRLIKWDMKEYGNAQIDTAMLARTIGIKDSKNARRVLKSASLPENMVSVIETPGQKNRYVLNYEEINKLESAQVRTNYTPRKHAILTVEEGTLLNREDIILTVEEPNGYNGYSNSYRAASAESSPDAVVEAPPLVDIEEGSTVVPPASLAPIKEGVSIDDNDSVFDDDLTLLNREDKDEEDDFEWEDVELDEDNEDDEDVTDNMSIDGFRQYIFEINRTLPRKEQHDRAELSSYLHKINFKEYDRLEDVFQAVMDLRELAYAEEW